MFLIPLLSLLKSVCTVHLSIDSEWSSELPEKWTIKLCLQYAPNASSTIWRPNDQILEHVWLFQTQTIASTIFKREKKERKNNQDTIQSSFSFRYNELLTLTTALLVLSPEFNVINILIYQMVSVSDKATKKRQANLSGLLSP